MDKEEFRKIMENASRKAHLRWLQSQRGSDASNRACLCYELLSYICESI